MHDTPGGSPAPVVALPADLMFAARIRDAAQLAGVAVRIARTAQDVQAGVTTETRLVIIDLDWRGGDPVALIRALKEDPAAAPPILAYVSHVREDLIGAAQAAGAERVIARGAFARQVGALLAPYR